MIFGLYAKLANLTSYKKRGEFLTVEEMPRLVDQLNDLKSKFSDWKQSLPQYYEPISLPAQYLDAAPLEQDDLLGFPYEIRLDYITCMTFLIMCLIRSICGALDEFV